MSEEASARADTWKPSETSPFGWIAVGVIVALIGAWIAASMSEAVGLALVGLGSLPALVGVVAYGVELGVRRASR
jgi:hypothetical protein